MVSIVWGGLLLIGIAYSFISGNISLVNDEVLKSSAQALEMFLTMLPVMVLWMGKSSAQALEMFLTMLPVMVLWMGLMQIASDSGLLSKVAYKFSFVLKKLFPSIPEGHESLGLIASNIIVNMVGLGGAATPFGLKAMEKLQELNDKKDTATPAMITFLVLNTSGVTLIPTSIISLRAMYGSNDPSAIIAPALLATLCSTVAGLTVDYLIRRKNR